MHSDTALVEGSQCRCPAEVGAWGTYTLRLESPSASLPSLISLKHIRLQAIGSFAPVKCTPLLTYGSVAFILSFCLSCLTRIPSKPQRPTQL